MPRESSLGMKHVKSVKRHGKVYLYFNTGQLNEHKRPIYTPLGIKGTVDVGARYTLALAARTRRAGSPGSLSLPQLVDRYQRSKEFTDKSVGTQRTYAVYLNRLAAEFNTATADDVEPGDLYDLTDEMGDAAADMLLLAGGQMYTWAIKRRMASGNPFGQVDRKYWQAAEYEPWPEDVLEAALNDDKLGLPVALLYFTAQRIGDCCAMRWDDIQDGELSVCQQKTGKALHIPVHARLAEALAKAPRNGETILADDKGRKAKDQTIRWRIREFGKARGIKLVPHGLRKNAVNALLEAECSTAETSAISGQSLRMVEHYARNRNSRRMGKRAMAKWERAGNRETDRKLEPESAVK